MLPIKSIFIGQILLLSILCLEAVKIGISKPLPVTTTLAPNANTSDATTEEVMAETSVMTTAATDTNKSIITTTTTKATSNDAEWPEFPPKKASNKTTTKKPITTTLKPSTTTPASTTTVLPELQNTTASPEMMTTSSIPHVQFPNKYCFCDLNPNICDINCCCDLDCSPDAFKVFHCLPEKPIDLEVHEGRFEDFKFQHGLPSCQTNDGWLCVFRTYKPIVQEQATVPYGDTSHYYKWPNLLLESEDIKNREFYKYGDILRTINMDTKEIQNFDLPASFKSTSCLIREPVYHLKSIKRTCLIFSCETLKDIHYDLLNLQENHKILNKPAIPEDLYNNKVIANHIGNITIQQCVENEKNCTKYAANKNENDYGELFKIKVNVLHNFTHIQHMILSLWLRKADDINSEETFTEYWLEYEVEFLNQTLKDFNAGGEQLDGKKPSIRSGPLGYLYGKPLIIARYEPFNKSLSLSAKNQVINYFLENSTDSHTLSLFGKQNGVCTRHNSNSIQQYISFGINEAKYCKIKLDNDTLLWQAEPVKINFTKICVHLQAKINEQLFGTDLSISDLTSYMISELGKPENDTKKWLPLLVYNTDYNAAFGQYLQETNTFICRNILLSLTYEFHMATLTVHDTPSQHVIKHSALHLAERHDLEFALDENLEVPITMTVRFFDAHEKAVSAGGIFKNLNLIYMLIIDLVLVFNCIQ